MMGAYSILLVILALLASRSHAQEQTTNVTRIDCSEFQSKHSFASAPITLDYVVTTTADDDETSSNVRGGLFTARVTYEGQGYVSVGFSRNGFMVGSLAVIGLPDEPLGASNPGKYNMPSYSLSDIALTNQQTLLNGNIEQNDTHTVMTFSKYLQEDGEDISINPSGSNFILVAAGGSNSLSHHRHRDSVGLVFEPCRDGALVDSNVTLSGATTSQVLEGPVLDNKQNLFRAHGWTAVIAWGVLAPLAISNSLCRHLIPGQGIWFQLHQGLNLLVLVLTTISFALVVKAINDASGGNAKHFQTSDGAMGKHHTIGLVVFILVIVQSIGGMVRPHVPNKGENPSAVRVLWEVGHRLSGMALLAMAFYQCHSGLVLYARRFVKDDDYVEIFWAITGTICGIGLLGKIHGLVTIKPDSEADVDKTSENEDLVMQQSPH